MLLGWKTFPRAVLILSLISSPQWGLSSQAVLSAADVVARNSFLKLGNQILETEKMKELYTALGVSNIWFANGQLTRLGLALPQVLKDADRNGLNSTDYWTPILERLYQKPTAETAISLELSATEAFIRFATDLMAGRIEPSQLDDDIKFKRKKLDMTTLAQVLQRGQMSGQIDIEPLAPQMRRYQDLRTSLAQLRRLNDMKAIPDVKAPEIALSPGDSHPILGQLKKKMKILGYSISDSSDFYGADLEMAVFDYQRDNRLPSGAKLLPNGNFWRHISVSPKERIRQIEMTMEKLRWLPQSLESRHIFTNLAFQMFRLYENGELTIRMRTINGQPHRRTPTMRDQITDVELNPSWTVPTSIAIKDKIPQIRKDIGYLAKARISVHDAKTWQKLDPYSIDWDRVTANNMNFYLQQEPGPQNALGLFKFHLTNPWAIYYHDTGDRDLFTESSRELSSGCIRLANPQDLALYLLSDNPKWNAEFKIQDALADNTGRPFTPKIQIPVSRPIPSYTMYLTAEVSDDGRMAFTADSYGQDARLWKMITAKREAEGSGGGDEVGQLLVEGSPGKGQAFAKVRAIRCSPVRRFACDAAKVFDLNKPSDLPVGKYIVSFENSLHDGWVDVAQGKLTTLKLSKLSIPEGVKAEKSIRVFRDLTSATEQRKFLWAAFHLGGHPTPLAVYDFGDLYPAASNKRDVMARISPAYCLSQAMSLDQLSLEGKNTCLVLLKATSPEQLAGNFIFHDNGTVTESFVTSPGDWNKVTYQRHLISIPMADLDHVAAFSGDYRISVDQQKESISLKSN